MTVINGTSVLRSGAVALALLMLVACAPHAQSPTAPGARSAESGSRAGTKTLTLGISAPPSHFSLPSAAVPAGGWVQITELHSEGLITSAPNSRQKIGRLAEKVPTLEDGSIRFLPDGKMRLVFPL